METGGNLETVSLRIGFADHMRRFPSVRFEVVVAVRMKITDSWDMKQCSHCLHHQGSTELHIVTHCDTHCHHGMARPQVAEGGDALQVWRVAADILNKKSRTAYKGWSFRLGVGRGAKNSSPYKISLLRTFGRSLGPGRILWINDLSERKWI
jgi:hypothetical protein